MSTEITAWLDEAQAQADAATEGPWELAPWNELVTLGVPYFDPDGEPDQLIVSTAGNRRTDAAFIADARTRLPQAIAALRAVGSEDTARRIVALTHQCTPEELTSDDLWLVQEVEAVIAAITAQALGVQP